MRTLLKPNNVIQRRGVSYDAGEKEACVYLKNATAQHGVTCRGTDAAHGTSTCTTHKEGNDECRWIQCIMNAATDRTRQTRALCWGTTNNTARRLRCAREQHTCIELKTCTNAIRRWRVNATQQRDMSCNAEKTTSAPCFFG